MVRGGLFVSTVVLLLADQLTKFLVRVYEPTITLGIIHVKLAYNTGIAFSMFSGNNYAFIANLAVIILTCAFFIILYKTRSSYPDTIIYNIFLGLIIGGAFGNLIDRLWIGRVTDFIATAFWPTFNLADSGITIGVLGIVTLSLFEPLSGLREKRKASPPMML